MKPQLRRETKASPLPVWQRTTEAVWRALPEWHRIDRDGNGGLAASQRRDLGEVPETTGPHPA